MPRFTKGADQTVNEDAGADRHRLGHGHRAGPADESGQTLNFWSATTTTRLFSAQPAIAANGTLTYTPAANANGTATVSVTLQDMEHFTLGVAMSDARALLLFGASFALAVRVSEVRSAALGCR